MLFLVRMRVGTGLLVLGACAFVAGCGKGTGDINGTVTYKGTPLKFGTVSVIDSEEKSQAGEIQPDGTYSIKKVALGPAKVTVSATDPKVREEIKDMLAKSRQVGAGGKFAGERPDQKKLSVIPEKYSNPDKSGLTVDVQRGATSYNISLTD